MVAVAAESLWITKGPPRPETNWVSEGRNVCTSTQQARARVLSCSSPKWYVIVSTKSCTLEKVDIISSVAVLAISA